MKHIRDCWAALDECKTYDEVCETVENFPRWSGDWEVDTSSEYLVVRNSFYDSNTESYEEAEEELDLLSPEF